MRGGASGRGGSRIAVAAVAAALAVAVGGSPAIETKDDAAPVAEPLTLGLLVDLTGALSEFGPGAEQGARLAVEHVNAAGGVLGHPVAVEAGDAATDVARSVAEARRLVEVAGVDVLVQSGGSAMALAVAERVTVPARVPTVLSAATAPAIRDLRDDGYVFRTTPSDAAQGRVLSDLARAEGHSRVAVVYRDDAYGRGLAETFVAAFEGTITASLPLAPERSSYLEELRRARDAGPSEVLVTVTFPFEAEVLVEEAIREGLFTRFLFVDANRSPELVGKLGAALDGMKGTAPGSPGLDRPSTRAVADAFATRYGGAALAAGPVFSTYDAVVCLCLAAELAGSTRGDAVRDALPRVCGGRGETVHSGPGGVAEALAAIRAGRPIDYDGAASDLDWDEHGEVTVGEVAVWEYRDGAAVNLEQVAFRL